MADLTTFKTYDPIAQIIASGGGASSLPLIGGTLMGNLILTPPFRVIQCQTPGNPCDVVNLVYLQALYLPLTGSTMSGAISQPMAPVAATDLTNKAYVDAQSGAPDATTLVKGKVQLAGDLDGTASLPVIGPNKVTYPKIQQVGASSLLGNSTGVSANVQEITLGSLVFSSNILNSPVSNYSGTDPNITTPTDRPSLNSTLYMGTDNLLWIFNGALYVPLTPQKFIAFAKNLSDQALIPDGLVEFTPLTINRPSTQGLTIVDSLNGGVFSITLDVNRPQIFLKITVSISGLYTPGVIAKFFTYNLTNAAYTLGPGMILNNGNATQITSTHTYSEILPILPGTTTDIGVRLRTITGAGIIDIGNGGGVSLPYRWIMFEEI